MAVASPEEPSMRLFSVESDRIRSSLAARAVSSSFTLALKTEFFVRANESVGVLRPVGVVRAGAAPC